MPISVAEIDRRVGFALNDVDSVRWTPEERFAWINDAAAEIIGLRPAAGGTTDTVDLTAGVSQSIPDDGVMLLDVVRNIKADDTPGRAVQRANRDLLDAQDPDWYARDEVDKVQHYTFDDRAPRSFYVYPPVLEGTKVELLYAKLPEAVSAVGDKLGLSAVYLPGVVSYVLYRALAKDSEYGQGAVAQSHLQAFMNAMGQFNQVAMAAGPKGEINESP